MKQTIFAGLAVLALASCSQTAQAPKEASVASGFHNVPIPADVKVVPPAANVPKQLAAYSGRWTGTWGPSSVYQLHHVLIVEQVTAKGAEVVYAWGDEHNAYVDISPDWTRGPATFDGDKLIFDQKNWVATYTPLPNGTLQAHWRGKVTNNTAQATMTKDAQ